MSATTSECLRPSMFTPFTWDSLKQKDVRGKPTTEKVGCRVENVAVTPAGVFTVTAAHTEGNGNNSSQAKTLVTHCRHASTSTRKETNSTTYPTWQVGGKHFSKLVGFISRIHLAKRPWKALVKGRPIQKLESDWTNLLSTTIKVDQSDLFTASRPWSLHTRTLMSWGATSHFYSIGSPACAQSHQLLASAASIYTGCGQKGQ